MSFRKGLDDDQEQEYELPDIHDTLDGSAGQRLSKFIRLLASYPSGLRLPGNVKELHRVVIRPEDPKYKLWVYFVVFVAVYSSIFTPIEFGFFRGLPEELWVVDLAVQFVFLADIILTFFVVYRDRSTYRVVVERRHIAIRYIKSDLVLDILGVMPWDTIYANLGRKEWVRYLVWCRLYRVRKVENFFQKMEKDIRISYFVTRIFKLLSVEFYATHTAACLFYYLATTMSASAEHYTWIGSLTLGAYSYEDFRSIGFWKRYVVSMYWAVLTMATVGYGDVHAVSPREMIFVIIYVSFDMILGAYLIGNMTALIVKGSQTERFRDKMAEVIKYMNCAKLPTDIRRQMKSHVRLQFESRLVDSKVIEDLPVSIRTKISRNLYGHILEKVQLFNGCSNEFVSEIVSKLVEETFLPGEVVIQQGGSADQLYIVANGFLEEVLVGEGGAEEIVSQLLPQFVFGEVGMLLSIPQPFTVRVVDLSSVLRVDKQSFTQLVQIYYNDGRQIISNLVQWNDTDARVGPLTADINFAMAKQEAELALMVNNASYNGDLRQLQQLVKAGADVAKADYDGRTPLHLAASKAYDDVVLFLIKEGALINAIDKFGITPLQEAVSAGNDATIEVLIEKGAQLHLLDPGSHLCQVAMSGNMELMKRLITAGADLASCDYDKRTSIHIASAEGNFAMVKLLIDVGADVLVHDRWHRTPLDEALSIRSSAVVSLIKDALQKRRPAVSSSSTTAEYQSTTNNATGTLPGAFGNALKLHEMQKPRDIVTSTTPSTRSPSGSEPSSPDTAKDSRDTSLERLPSGVFLSRSKMSIKRAAAIQEKLDQQHFVMSHESRVPSRLGTRRRVTILPYHPWAPRNEWRRGRVIWVPPSMEKLMDSAAELFGSHFNLVLNQDAGEITSVEFIGDNDKIYAVHETEAAQESMYSAGSGRVPSGVEYSGQILLRNKDR